MAMQKASMKFVGAALAFLPICALAAAADPAAEAFEILKGAEGKWALESAGKPIAIEMTYAIGSKGSIVTEQFGKELSVFYRDGAKLLMTHFCNAGNQPRLQLNAESTPDLFAFDMVDITNLQQPNAPHVQRVIYRLVDRNKMELEIFWQKGSESQSEKYALARK